MSSAAIVIVLVSSLYSSDSLPTLMSVPCFEDRDELRVNRFVDISCHSRSKPRASLRFYFRRQIGAIWIKCRRTPCHWRRLIYLRLQTCTLRSFRIAADENLGGTDGFNFTDCRRIGNSMVAQRRDGLI